MTAIGLRPPIGHVVLAAGAWTPALATPLGVRIPLQPAKGYSYAIAASASGGTLELASYDLRLDATRYRAVVNGAREVPKDTLELKNEEAWYGFRPPTPDGLLIISRVPGIDGLIVATGHAMLGFTQSPITVADHRQTGGGAG